MPHHLHRLLDTALNRPHLITESALAPIITYLTDRTYHTPALAVVQEVVQAPKKAEQVGGIGEIVIDGALTYKPVQAACSPEGCSYQGILEQAEELIAMGVDTIVLTHSSPGGEAQHAFSTANTLRSMATEAGVTLVSYVDTMSASASLALGIVADIVVIHPEARTGSIGCCCAIFDTSKAMEQAGVKPIYIASTPGKTPFQDDGSFSASFIAEMQADVTRLGDLFAQHVSTYTGIPVDEIVAMDAKMFHAEKAKELGLVNHIMDHQQFAAWLAETRGKE